MEIPLNAYVQCTDGVCGRSEYVLINPVIDQVTHLVVKEDSFLNPEYIVPIDFVTGMIIDTIRLRCSKAELENMKPFIKLALIEENQANHDSSNGIVNGKLRRPYFYWPYVSFNGSVQEPAEHKQIPPGELVVNRGTRIEATDGYVGKIDELVVNLETGQITHLVMREGHLWGQKDVIIPVSAMGDTHQDTLFLTLDKQQIESLPTFPLQRRWS